MIFSQYFVKNISELLGRKMQNLQSDLWDASVLISVNNKVENKAPKLIQPNRNFRGYARNHVFSFQFKSCSNFVNPI